MVNSTYFENNPKLYLFLPMLYVLWADSVLSKRELQLLEELIKSQKWINAEEQDFLEQYLNPENPPSPQTLKKWRKTILEAAETQEESLSTLGKALVKHHDKEHEAAISPETLESFQEAEEKIGLLHKETNYIFQKKHDTVTSQLQTESDFPVKKLTQLLEGTQGETIQKVKAVISDPSFKYPDKGDLQTEREQVYALCKTLAENGFGSWAFPKEYGGKGDMEGYFTIMETLSYHDLSLVIKFGVQFGLWGMSVFFLGSEKHHQKYLTDIGSLKLPGCFAMTETNHGSNVKGLETTATYSKADKTITINTPHEKACKEYIGNAAMHGQKATVFAKLIIDEVDYGVSAFVVPLRTSEGNLIDGVRIEDCGRKMGLNGVDNGKIWFDNVAIPVDDMLDKFSGIDDHGEFFSSISSDNRRFFTMLGTLVGGRIGIPRSALAAAKKGLTIAIRYSDQRKQFGPKNGEEVPILNYRMHQRRLLPPLATSYALHFSLQYLTKRFLNKTEDDAREIEALAAGLKAYTTWFTTATLQECREATGGKGYLWENAIPALKADTDIYTTFEGDNTVLMQLVAKNRLTEFKQEFGDMDFITVFNYLTNSAKVNLIEKNPIAVRRTDDEHLLDLEFHESAFRYREEHILSAAAQRLKRLIDDGMDSFDAFNVSGHHLVNVGIAYIERIVLEQFHEAIKNVEDESLKPTLDKLASLFALSVIEKNKGWYLEDGYMEGVKTKAIRKMVNQLSWELRKDAVALTEVFDIPENCLAAAIA
ncbi:acyl-CoA dehydrogenase family protein [Marivirga atlantica]|jgi:acyl-CoA oxidase|uniref:acyl-CoA oxidase n=1 Tax=Marivirga atlantica TaxID=1548457 RepID=A0A937DJB8_9BACT|nr:acyl-CoA dehydrogenase [Marivirga atlantica]MBL0764734.1 acyl-CoA dehydrogenase family protein [Marivirga atlantica]